jgi:ADP-heptose:LPS heptosyltransferase
VTSAAQVLVIKLSALGDFVLAFPAFARIRAAHPDAGITLLTTPPFEALAQASPFFDRVEIDGRPTSPGAWVALIRRLRRRRYDRVYDLQINDRTNLLFQMLRPSAPAWSGRALGCALPHRNRDRMRMHTLERQAEQLRDAGIWPDAPTAPLSAPSADLSWVLARTKPPRFLDGPFSRPLVLLAPGSSARRPEKRWPVERYAELAARLEANGFDVLVIGGLQEAELAHVIQNRARRARDLTGRTDLAQVAALGAKAAVAVGNDTGPTHLIAAAGAPTIALFSSASDPTLCGPRGRVTVMQAPDLSDMPVEIVLRGALALGRPSS